MSGSDSSDEEAQSLIFEALRNHGQSFDVRFVGWTTTGDASSDAGITAAPIVDTGNVVERPNGLDELEKVLACIARRGNNTRRTWCIPAWALLTGGLGKAKI